MWRPKSVIYKEQGDNLSIWKCVYPPTESLMSVPCISFMIAGTCYSACCLLQNPVTGALLRMCVCVCSSPHHAGCVWSGKKWSWAITDSRMTSPSTGVTVSLPTGEQTTGKWRRYRRAQVMSQSGEHGEPDSTASPVCGFRLTCHGDTQKSRQEKGLTPQLCSTWSTSAIVSAQPMWIMWER